MLTRRLHRPHGPAQSDRKSTRLNSSHTVIYTLSLHDALPICREGPRGEDAGEPAVAGIGGQHADAPVAPATRACTVRSEEHTSELQSHRDLHSFPTRRSSDLP